MTRHWPEIGLEAGRPASGWDALPNTRCGKWEMRLGAHVNAVLDGLPAPGGLGVALHLRSCPACARRFSEYIPLATAARVGDLEDLLLRSAQTRVLGGVWSGLDDKAERRVKGLQWLWGMRTRACRQLADDRGIATDQAVVGLALVARGRLKEAEGALREALTNATSRDQPLAAALSHTGLAHVALAHGQRHQALQAVNKSVELGDLLADEHRIARARFLLGLVHEARNEQKPALAEFTAALSAAAEAGTEWLRAAAGCAGVRNWLDNAGRTAEVQPSGALLMAASARPDTARVHVRRAGEVSREDKAAQVEVVDGPYVDSGARLILTLRLPDGRAGDAVSASWYGLEHEVKVSADKHACFIKPLEEGMLPPEWDSYTKNPKAEFRVPLEEIRLTWTRGLGDRGGDERC